MDVEQLLISKVIEDGDLGKAASITPDFFTDPIAGRVWSSIIDHVGRYGKVPSAAVVKADYPTYKLVKSPEPLEFWADRMIKHRSLSMVEAALTDAANLHLKGDLDKTLARLGKVISDVSRLSAKSTVINLADNVDDRLAHYEMLAKLDGRLRGIPSGFPAIDEGVSGFEPGQLVTFVGPAKAGKSTSLLKMTRAANESGYSTLFIGFEMSNVEQYERLDAMRAKIPHKKIRNGLLSAQERKILERAVRLSENLPDFYLVQDTASVMTLTGLRTKIEEIRPDIVYVDGVYMMMDELGEPSGSPQAITNITRGMKRLAQQLELPIVITTQALENKMRGKELTTYSIGYSSSFVQDSDLVLGVERTDDPCVVKIKTLAARNSRPIEVFYRWDWGTMTFEELENYDPEAGTDYADFEFAA